MEQETMYERFKGFGVVAFIDLLGFSAAVSQDWDKSLDLILKLKSNLQAYVPVSFGDQGGEKRYRPTVTTLSDSIVLQMALPEVHGGTDFSLAVVSVVSMAKRTKILAMEQNFAVRGAIEYGAVYFDGQETIGPAFNRAVQLEKSIKSSRIVFARGLCGMLHADINPMFDYVFEFIRPWGDELLSLRSYPDDGPHLRRLRDQAPEDKKCYYDEAIQMLEDDGPYFRNLGVPKTRLALHRAMAACEHYAPLKNPRWSLPSFYSGSPT